MSLSSQPASTSMIATIHTLKSRVGMDNDTYRDFLARETGKRSAKALSTREAVRVIEKLRDATGGAAASGAVAGLDSPIGGKLRALWIAAYDLGVARDRTDRAMLSFLQRQTGVSHTRFLRDARSGTAAIEGLKAWLSRAAGVEWPDSGNVIASKRAVIDAQWARLIALGAVKKIGGAVDPMNDLLGYAARITWLHDWNAMNERHYDDVQKALGGKLRAALHGGRP
ncbi:regulatory protein GemA [Nitrobacter winogradskyi]|uniref:Uncharacterized protein n=2 Tax=Nitrobacter winogradskyi TaxID=913 RepID=A0ACC6AIY4_NITWI|nr:regulatory protein GemA [Nitrobacter winogradskyi]MCP1998815.1 hypothetical protein [Nitrobacter winogradskyi]GEC14263.1 hypothetical protein NWI01_01550 [Nitrobacter winogradskyi]